MNNNIYQNKSQIKSHYVYHIYNKREKKHYIGVRSCKGNPIDDLGVKYFSSSQDKQFMTEQKEYPDNFYYKVLKKFKTRDEANHYEEYLLLKVNAHNNPKFYNMSIMGRKFNAFGKKCSKQHIEKNRKARCKYNYKIHFEDGRVETTTSLKQFEKENGYNHLIKVKKKIYQKSKDIIKIDSFDESGNLIEYEIKYNINKILYKIYKDNGVIIETDNLNKFSKENNYNISKISAVKLKQRKFHKDIIKIEEYINDVLQEYEIKYNTNEILYRIHKDNGVIIETNNLNKFANENGYTSGNLSQIKNNKIKYYKDIVKIEEIVIQPS